MASPKKRMDLSTAKEKAFEVKNWLNDDKVKCQICGSIRREREFVNDVDMVVGCSMSKAMSIIEKHASTVEVVVSGEKKTDVVINDTPFNLYFAGPHEWGSMVLFLTGSAKFNILCRRKAMDRNMKLNQYGLWNGGGTLITAQENTILRHLSLFDRVNPIDRE